VFTLSALNALGKKVAALEQCSEANQTIEMYIEGPEGQHWLWMADGTEYTGEEALRRLAQATWPDRSEGGIVHVIGVDADVVLGRKPEPDEETLRRWQEANRRRGIADPETREARRRNAAGDRGDQQEEKEKE
jgi:hypothetical protein